MKTLLNLAYDGASPLCALDLYQPEEGAKRAYLYFHGGGLSAGDKADPPAPQLAEVLTASGVALISANYRLAPEVSFPAYVEDCAKAVAWVMSSGKKQIGFDELYIGGSSAGAYLSAMLCFDARYLAPFGVDPLRDVAGYVLDAGQPTTHFSVLEARGEDRERVLIDEAAPMFFLNRRFAPGETLPRILNIGAEHDIPGRPEQNALMLQTMRNLGYPAEKITDCRMLGFSHCGYMSYAPYHRLTRDFITGGLSVACVMAISNGEA